MNTAYQQIRLEGLAKGFGIDIQPAQNLSGKELDRWICAVENAVPVLLLNTDAPIEQRLALAAWMLQGLHASADMASTSLASDGELRAILGGMVPTIELIQSLVEV